MELRGAMQLCTEYTGDSTDEEQEDVASDDSEVSVANMNRHRDNAERVAEEEVEEESGLVEEEDDNEASDEEDNVYSGNSLYSDSFRDSDMTNVTPRSSLSAASALNRTLSLECPLRGAQSCTEEVGSTARTFQRHSDLPRFCSSANDNRYFGKSKDPRQPDFPSRTKRRNMSFTNVEMRKIERDNQFLLKKIMAHQKPQNRSVRAQSCQPRVSSSAINRRKLQKKIEEENMMLLRKIQGAKACAVPTPTPGYRVTSL